MKGFTTMTSLHSREEIQKLLETQDNIVKPILEEYGGKIIKTIGDAFLVVFESPTNAVLCGVKIQDAVAEHCSHSGECKFEMRIAINAGEVNLKDDDVFGEPVNIASRIEAICEPGQVYFTEAVYLAMNKNEVPTAEVGHRYLKGIAEQIKVYKVLTEKAEILRKKEQRAKILQWLNTHPENLELHFNNWSKNKLSQFAKQNDLQISPSQIGRIINQDETKYKTKRSKMYSSDKIF